MLEVLGGVKRSAPLSARGPSGRPCATRLCLPQDAGSQQVGFLLGSCGVALALTTDACQKGLPKAQTGEVAAFKGGPQHGQPRPP